ncbi:Uncharacterised protein [Chlamydia trachomatis]|nr:Uncharacterised protein [Chlamydia trachomatis]
MDGGSIYKGFSMLVLETCTVPADGVMSNTAGVVVEDEVISKPSVPVKVGIGDPD